MVDFENFKSQFEIVDVASRLGLNLKKKGSIYHIDCPTGHSSKSGTCCHIIPNIQGIRCWSCDFTCDVIGLVSQVRFGSLTQKKEAIEWLCEQQNISVPWETWTSEEKEKYLSETKEKKLVRSILKEACSYWHQNTPPEMFEVLQKNYGITAQTTKSLLIGYASGAGLYPYLIEKGYSKEELLLTGLFNKQSQFEFFKKRLIFPYWSYGEVVYLIARRVDETIQAPKAFWSEDSKYEQSKYKKLRVHDENPESPKHTISQTLRNDYLYGESKPGGESIILTEGVTDCIASNQADFPCLSPATVRFKKDDLERLWQKVQHFKKVYLCNDVETEEFNGKSGEKGALATAKFLLEKGADVYLITLPKPEQADKIDLCEYLRDHSPKDFQKLIDKADHAIEFLAKQITGREIDRLEEALPLLKVIEQMPKTKQKYYLERLKTILKLGLPLLREGMKEAKEIVDTDDKKTPPGQSEIADSFAEEMPDFRWHVTLKHWMQYQKGLWSQISRERFQQILFDFIKTKTEKCSANFLHGTEKILHAVLHQEDWTQQRNLIPMKDGVLDLDTLQMKEHRRENYFTWQCEYNYDPGVDWTTIKEWLYFVAEDDQNTVDVLCCFLAAGIRGMVEEQKFLELIGQAGSGKTTFMKLGEALVGKRNTRSTDLKTFEEDKFEMQRMVGKRLIFFPDSESYGGKVENLRKLTGQDPIPIRLKHLHSDAPDWTAEGLVIIGANKPIKSNDYSNALGRRRITIEFNNVVHKSKLRKLIQEFQPCLPGFFSALLAIPEETIRSVLQKAGDEGKMVEAKVKTLLENPIAAWFNQMVILDPEALSFSGVAFENEAAGKGHYLNEDVDLFPSFCSFCHGAKLKSLSLSRFGRDLKSLLEEQLPLPESVQKTGSQQKRRGWHGIRIRTLSERPGNTIHELYGGSESLRQSATLHPTLIPSLNPTLPTLPILSDTLRNKEEKHTHCNRNGHEENPLFLNRKVSDPPSVGSVGNPITKGAKVSDPSVGFPTLLSEEPPQMVGDADSLSQGGQAGKEGSGEEVTPLEELEQQRPGMTAYILGTLPYFKTEEEGLKYLARFQDFHPKHVQEAKKYQNNLNVWLDGYLFHAISKKELLEHTKLNGNLNELLEKRREFWGMN